VRTGATKKKTRAGRKDESSATLAEQLVAKTRELDKSLQQQAATAEVLKIISRSAFDLQKVLDTLVEAARRLCEASDAGILLREGESLVVRAHHGPIPIPFVKRPLTRAWTSGRAVLDREPVHVPDIMAAESEFPEGYAMSRRVGQRTTFSVPLLRGSEAIGCFFFRRTEVRPFSPKQIELASTFADQAVIAIENARLFAEVQARTKELTESLEQQTATSNVLQVISTSPGELTPVFETILENATRICEAKFGNLLLYDGQAFQFVAFHNVPAEFVRQVQGAAFGSHPDGPLSRLSRTKRPVHVTDLRTELVYKERSAGAVALVERAGARSLINVPMLKGGQLLGMIGIYRQEVRPFTDSQISLVDNFAKQAVIAIENTRLLNELRESLRQQTATADVLKVISRSTFDLQTVLDTLVESAARLCEADRAAMTRPKSGFFEQIAWYGFTPEQRDYMKTHPIPSGRGSPSGRTFLEGQVVHIADVRADPEMNGFIFIPENVWQMRTFLGVPLIREGAPIGVFALQRKTVRPFTDKQVELVTIFANQAVIAIENARLFNEVQTRTKELTESLEQQTATSEVLRVISSSPGELEPVFDTMLVNATRLCEARFGILTLYDGEVFRGVATHNLPPGFSEMRKRTFRPPPGSAQERVVATKEVVHFIDAREDDPNYAARDPLVVDAIEVAGVRTLVVVPMLKDNKLIGAMTIYRQEVRPFTNKQIDLVKNFAKQAVIAIENTRLLNELRESLQQQTATADVLKVISRSTFDLQTVFDTLVQSAAQLCDADMAALNRATGAIRPLAFWGNTPEQVSYWSEHPIPLGRGSIGGRAIVEARTIHVHDVLDDPEFELELKEQARASGVRTMLAVPLMRTGTPIGFFALGRRGIRPFTNKQIELVETFADQAVIAIENVRLFDEVQARTKELTESLEQQTATSEVLGIISSSPGELEPVFKKMLENAVRVCNAKFGAMLLHEEGVFRHVALHNMPPAFAELIRRDYPVVNPAPDNSLSRVVQTKQPVHITDIREEPGYLRGVRQLRDLSDIGGVRTRLMVPMLQEDKLMGVIGIFSEEVRPFTDKQIELVQNFAKQAVIAIENARLLKELRESLEQETATSEVLKVISSSPDALEPVFSTILESATRICDARFGTLFRYDGELFHRVASTGTPSALVEFQRQRGPFKAENASTILGQVVATKTIVHIADGRESQSQSAPVKLGGARSMVAVPMLKDDQLVGAIAIYRQQVRPFSDKQIKLFSNFAAQAVIAIENARLLNELRESLEQQTATSEVLQVISSSPGELEPVGSRRCWRARRVFAVQRWAR
jgi:GAF domain-containing protein